MPIHWNKERSNSARNISKYLGSSSDHGSSQASKASGKMKPASAVFKPYGKHVFMGRLAEHYLTKHGGIDIKMADSTWVKDRKKADIVAAAVLDW